MTKETKKNETVEIVFILDKSGSMAGLESDTVGGFNSMIERQRKEGAHAIVSTVLFDTDRTVLHDRVPLEKVAPMTESEYFVGGCTALYDAIGSAIGNVSTAHRYAREEDVPGRTMFIITTDGMENASREYGREALKKLIEKKREEGWEFIFLAANVDAECAAEEVGISRERAVKYTADGTGTQKVFRAMSKAISAVRTSRPMKAEWREELDEDLKNRR